MSVLISIILGLGITQLVTGLGRLIQARRRIQPYAPTLTWVALLLVIHVQTWWSMLDLRANYFDQARWFFSLLVLLLVVSLVKDVVLSGSLPSAINVGAHVVFIATSVVAALTQREWYHRQLAPFSIVLMLAYIGVLFAQLS